VNRVNAWRGGVVVVAGLVVMPLTLSSCSTAPPALGKVSGVVEACGGPPPGACGRTADALLTLTGDGRTYKTQANHDGSWSVEVQPGTYVVRSTFARASVTVAAHQVVNGVDLVEQIS